jgi:hypothetical protein
MNELWCCFDWEEEEAEYAFECQAPVRRGMSKNEIPSPQKNSIRSDMALPSISDSELGSYFEVQPIDPLPVCRLFAQSGRSRLAVLEGPTNFAAKSSLSSYNATNMVSHSDILAATIVMQSSTLWWRI